jgi:hypothetical protein
MNNTDPTKTGFTEKYVYKADFDKKNNLSIFYSEIIEPIESKLVGLQLCIVID